MMARRIMMAVTRWLLIWGIAISGGVSLNAQAEQHTLQALQPLQSAQRSNHIHSTMLTHPPVDGLLRSLQARFPAYSTQQVLLVDTTIQRLMLIEQGQVVRQWIISSAEAGLGSRKGSNRTPLGVHRVAKRYGDGAAIGAIFKARRNTGRVAKILTAPGARSRADNITSRILWLDGLEPGFNKGGNVDSFQRYIYIHGTDEEGRLGQPASHGCIRMRNRDVIELYDQVGVDTLVVIAQQQSGAN